MKYRLLLGVALFGLTSCGESGGGGSDVRLEHGMWEVETELVNISGEGLPPEMMNAMRGRKETTRTCITREQAANPEAGFLAGQQNANCRNSSFTMRGGTIEATMTCSGGPAQGNGEMTMELEGTYEPRTYDINMEMQISGQDPGKARQSMNLEVRARGRRVSDCPGGSDGGNNSVGNNTVGSNAIRSGNSQ